MSFMLSAHILFLILWSASLLYFPQLVVREAATLDAEVEREAIRMQRTLYAWIMTPAGLLTVLAGSWLLFERGFEGGWLPVKLALVTLLAFFHAYCGSLMDDYKRGRIRRHLWFFGLLPLVPALLILAVVTLVVGKPF
ncbi:MAG: CopD family protein [Thiohalobacteraceae bacterium]